MTLEDVGPDNWRHCLGKQAAEQIANSILGADVINR
jgi:hypothetical protein